MDVFYAANGSSTHWSSAEELSAPEAAGNAVDRALEPLAGAMSASSTCPVTAAGVTDRSLHTMLGASPSLFGEAASAAPAQEDYEGSDFESEADSMGGYPAPGAASSAAAAVPQAKTKKSKKTANAGKFSLGDLLYGTSVAAALEGNYLDMEDLLMMAMVEALTRSSLGKNAKVGSSSFDDYSSGTDGHAELLPESAAGVVQGRRSIQKHFQNAPLKVIDGKEDGKHPPGSWKAKEAARREAAARAQVLTLMRSFGMALTLKVFALGPTSHCYHRCFYRVFWRALC